MSIKMIRLVESTVKISYAKLVTIPRIFALPVMRGNIFTEGLAGVSVHHP